MEKPKHAGGRPPKVHAGSNHVELAWAYIKTGWVNKDEAYPSVPGLIIWLHENEAGLNKDTLYARPEFSDALTYLKNVQEYALSNGGLNNKLNPTITKLILSSNHGYAEKSQTDLTSKGEKLDSVVSEETAKKFALFLEQETKGAKD